jgi:hypothetical protein
VSLTRMVYVTITGYFKYMLVSLNNTVTYGMEETRARISVKCRVWLLEL